LNQCCGSGKFISGSRIRTLRSRIPGQKDSGSRIRIHIKEFKYFEPKKMFPSFRKYDLVCSSQIRILIFYPSRIPESKRHRIPDPQHWLELKDLERKKAPPMNIEQWFSGSGSKFICHGSGSYCLDFQTWIYPFFIMSPHSLKVSIKITSHFSL
jgi:hypothetical protein